ncbi:unnamed protein product [Lymnaea stagnalis]|uniref:DUF7789 domain-containing protein n=1 Tax=Lymnaea stagnalis TaxID=6523 RepID=A0AAV2HVF4_LYMST
MWPGAGRKLRFSNMMWSHTKENSKCPAPFSGRELPYVRVMEAATYGSVEDLTSFSKKQTEVSNKSYKMDGDVESESIHESRPPLTFADLGIPTGAQLQDTMVGKARRPSDISWKERIYIVFMLVSILAASGFTIYRLITVWDDPTSNSTSKFTNADMRDAERSANTDFTFGLVLLLNAVFCIWFVIEGVLRERPSELLILTIATVIVMVYLIVNYTAGVQNDVKMIRLIIACVCCPLLVVLGLNIAWQYHVSKQLIFRTVGASETLQVLYRNLLAFQDFLKFDLELGGSMIILILVTPNAIKLRDIIILSVGGAFTLVWFFLGFFSMPKESTVMAIIFFLFSPTEIAYIGYKMYDVSNYIDKSSGLAGATIACGIVALVVRLLVIIGGIMVFRGFGQGLKDKLKS